MWWPPATQASTQGAYACCPVLWLALGNGDASTSQVSKLAKVQTAVQLTQAGLVLRHKQQVEQPQIRFC